jgi:Domain of unknown function (DUF4440)
VASLHDEVEHFFQRYARAAESMDPTELAGMHNAPCVKVHGDGRIECLPTPEAVHAFFQKLATKYEARDHGGGRYLDLEVTPMGTAAALASLTWEQFRTDGRVYRRFRRSYNLVRVASSWKILAATAHRE